MKILVINDSPLVLSGICRLLERNGFSVLEALSAEQGLEIVFSDKPDIILLDIVLPKIGGLELLRKIKSDEKTADIFVVLMSAYKATTEDKVLGLDEGADAFISFPIPNQELLALVESFARTKRAEKSARESNELLSTIFSSTNFLIAYLDGNFDYIRVNKAFADALGARRKDMVGANHFDFFTDKPDRPIFKKVIETGVAHVAYQKSLAALNHPEGTVRYWDWSLVPVKEKRKKVKNLVLSLNEVTAKVELDEKLRRSEKKYRMHFEKVSDVLFTLDHGMTLTDVSPAVKKHLGYSPRELIGKDIRQLPFNSEETKSKVISDTKELLKGKRLPTLTYELFCRQGRKRHFEIKADPYPDERGAVTIFGVARDISDRIAVQRELENKTQELGERVKELNCLYGIAQIVEKSGPLLENILRGIADFFPQGLRYPESALAKIVYRDRSYSQESFVRTRWCLKEKITAFDKPVGELQVCYFERKWEKGGREPFIHEERNLIQAVVERIGRIIERFTTERALRESEYRYRTIVETAREGIWEIDANGNTSLVNEQMASMLGYEKYEMLGRSFIEFMDPELVDAAQSLLTRRKEGISEQHQFRFQRKDGSQVWTLVSATPYSSADDSFMGGVAMVSDITDLKKTEEELEKSRQRLEEAHRMAGLGSWEYDIQSGRIKWSKEVYRIFEIEKGTSINYKKFMGFVHPDDRNYLDKHVKQWIEQKSTESFDYRIVLSDGAVKHIYGVGEVASDPSGKNVKMFGTVQDITKLKVVEKELREAKEIAENASKAKSDFLANMSHEIRTPISNILGLAEIARDISTNREVLEHLTMINRSANSLLSIVNDVLDISKIEAHRLELREESFNPRHMLESLVGAFAPAVSEKGLKFSLKVHPEVPEYLLGAHERIRQVLRNLVSNAIKFTHRGRIELWVKTQKVFPDGRCRLLFSVSDTGIGIPDEVVPRMFKMFSQADHSYAKKYSGTGLGLVISKYLVEMLGGTIWFEKGKSQGTVFHFTVDLKVPDKKEAKAEQKRLQTTGPDILQEPVKILVGEDDPYFRKVLAHFLAQEGHRARYATNGKDVLVALCEDDFDLILLDMQMPEMDGLETIKRIRNSRSGKFDPRVPIIALTAYAMEKDRESILGAGADDFISKPVNFKYLMERIGRVVKRCHGLPTSYPETVDPRQDPDSCAQPVKEEIIADIEDFFRENSEDYEFIWFILGTFQEDSLERKRKLDEALRDRDFAALSKAAHKMTALFSSVPIFSQARLCQSLEEAANLKNLQHCLDMKKKMDDNLAQINQYLNQHPTIQKLKGKFSEKT